MESTLGLSTELSSLIEKGLIWRGEASNAAQCSALLRIEQDQRFTTQKATTQKATMQRSTGWLLPNNKPTGDTPAAMRQLFLPHGLPLGTVHEWCVAQSSHETISPLKKRSTSVGTPAGVPPFSIITAILRSTLSHQIKTTSNATSSSTGQSSTAPSSPVLDSRDPCLILWIGKNCWPTPHLLAQASHSGVNLLSRSLFIDPPDTKTKLWAIDAALRSSGVLGVIAQCSRLSTTMSRRFALAAAHGGTIGFIVRPEKELALPSAAMSRWRVRATPNCLSSDILAPFLSHPRWEVALLKCKGSFILPATLPVRWFVEVCNEISLSFPAELVSGSNKAETDEPAERQHTKQKPKRQRA